MARSDDVLGKPIAEWEKEFPILAQLTGLQPVFWTNPSLKEIEDLPDLSVRKEDIFEAEKRWHRFAPFLEKEFPETEGSGGIIESPLRPLPNMKNLLENSYNRRIDGQLYLKCDSELPIAGSIKARGGIYEVLKHAETLAFENGLITEKDSYDKFATPAFKRFFNQYTISVASTGNLGLSIGVVSAALGFNVKVHMSADAKPWKKRLLRKKGAEVYEYQADFSKAIKEGRELSNRDPNSYFVDDEDSRDLFLGYSVAALRLKKQLDEQGVFVDEHHPLFLYLPCGVGGSPGGITFGLKHVFGDHAHCFFVEPTHSPSVFIGLLTGQYGKVSVQDFGIDNRTEADGLAVGTPSRFATEISEHLVSGIYTIEDDELFKLLAWLIDSEEIHVEPSAASGLQGPIRLQSQSDYVQKHHLTNQMSDATHIAWATGGAFVPEADMDAFYQKGKNLLAK